MGYDELTMITMMIHLPCRAWRHRVGLSTWHV